MPLRVGLQAQAEPGERGAGLEARREGDRFEELMAARGDTSLPTTPGTSARTAPVTTALLRQVADVIGHLRDGPVEVKLRPEELGLVRMTLQQTETALVLQVSAERPDTLDLMRRHAEVLARELADAGFGSVDIDFGSARGGADEDGAPERSGTDSTDTGPGADEAETLPDNALTRRAGLDIRI